MKFNWNSKSIIKDLKELKKELQNENDLQKQEQLCKYISYVTQMLHSIIDEEMEFEEETNEKYYRNLKEDFHYYEIYYQIVKEFKRKLRNVDFTFEQTEQFSMTKDDELELVNEFYKTIGQDYYKLFKKEFDLRYKNLRFDSGETGGMFYIPKIDHSYIRAIDSCGNVEPNHLNVLIHEYAHAISAKINPERYINSGVLLLEIESQFFELVSSDFFSQQLNSKSFYTEDINMLDSYFITAQSIIDSKRIIKEYDNLSFLSDEEFEVAIPHLEIPFDIKFRNFNITEGYRYLISYIIAVELYMIYIKDKDKALDKLRRIISTKITDSEYLTIINEVTPNQNINLYKRKTLQKVTKDARY